MPFKEATRNWWMRVAGGKCQWEYYTEENGWLECGDEAEEVHHIIPEGWVLDRGGDPEHEVGLPLCRRHHSRNSGDEEWGFGSSFHPDIGEAFREYGDWKQQEQHMAEIADRPIDYSNSPFAEAVREHRAMSEEGERYWTGTEEIDKYYEEKMREKAVRHIAENPDDPKPKTQPSPKMDRSKRPKRWYDFFFEEDEEEII